MPLRVEKELQFPFPLGTFFFLILYFWTWNQYTSLVLTGCVPLVQNLIGIFGRVVNVIPLNDFLQYKTTKNEREKCVQKKIKQFDKLLEVAHEDNELFIEYFVCLVWSIWYLCRNVTQRFFIFIKFILKRNSFPSYYCEKFLP